MKGAIKLQSFCHFNATNVGRQININTMRIPLPHRKMVACCLLILAAVHSPTANAIEPVSHRRWGEQILYTIIWEKYCDGDPSNDFMRRKFQLTDAGRAGFQSGFRGGDCAGILKHVPDLKKLGITSLVVYPVVENDTDAIPGPTMVYLPTGYRPADFLRIDPNFAATSDPTTGFSREFANLIRALHATDNGPRINYIMDLPVAMVGADHPWVTHASEYPGYLRPWNIDPAANIGSSPMRVATGLVDNAWGMACINHVNGMNDRSATYQYLTHEVMIGLAKRYGLDGYRYDSVHNIDRRFLSRSLTDFRKAINSGDAEAAFMHLGEAVIKGAPRSWQMRPEEYMNDKSPDSESPPELDGIYDFDLIEAIQKVLAEGQPVEILQKAFELDGLFERPNHRVVSIDNYDDAFVHHVKDGHAKERSFLAMTFVATANRVPMLFAGNEYGEYLANLGDLERMSNADARYRQHIASILDLRRQNSALRSESIQFLHGSSPNVVTFLRRDADGTFVIALNNSPGTETDRVELPKGMNNIRLAKCLINSDGNEDSAEESVRVEGTPTTRLVISLKPFHAVIVQVKLKS
jgi:glycosidase